jgi:hypothetical protein
MAFQAVGLFELSPLTHAHDARAVGPDDRTHLVARDAGRPDRAVQKRRVKADFAASLRELVEVPDVPAIESLQLGGRFECLNRSCNSRCLGIVATAAAKQLERNFIVSA